MTRIERRSFFNVWRTTCGLSAVMLLLSIVVGHAEYRLDVDDVVEITVAGLPDLKQRVTVQVDGTISFPVLGSVPVIGLTTQELRSKIQMALAAKTFRARAADGKETTVIIEPDQVTAALVDFRPIFIDGDVAKPGQLPFRPLMTVRQAVALAGGYELMRFRMNNNPFLESSDLRSEYETAWAEFIKEQAHIWRLRSELGDKAELNQKALRESPVQRPTVAEIVTTEARQLEMRRTDLQREKTFIQDGITQINGQISILTQQREKEAQGEQADIAELKKMNELYAKGSLPSPRVVDARRAVLLSATRRLQTEAQLMQAQKLQRDLARQLERIDDIRKIDLLRELQDANVRLASLSARLRNVQEKLHYTGIVKSQLARGKGAKPDITVIRRSDHGQQRITADEEFELSPGDVIDVALRDPLPEPPAQ
jgi:polysaccharide export outer membrane protein